MTADAWIPALAGMTADAWIPAFAGMAGHRDDFLAVDFRPEDLRPVDFFLALVRATVLREAALRGADLRADVFDARLRGVFSPFSRASFIPIASACFRLVTLRPPRVLSVPCLRRRIALPTVALALLLYFLPDDFLLDLRADVL
jgi:uncharacterized protein YjbI with pentapeptide repeats